MKIKTTTPIRELIAQLPPGTRTEADDTIGKALRDCIKALREPIEGTNLFNTEVRHALALELTAAMAQIIQARIPRNPRGRPPAREPAQKSSRREELEAEWIAKREAKAAIDAERKELQDLKRKALEVRESLEVFEAIAVGVAAREQAGMPVDNEQRIERLAPAIRPVSRALDALKGTPCRHDHLREQAEAMSTNYEALAGAISRWCTVKNVLSEGKAGGAHKSKALAGWYEACRTLSRDIAEALRELK